MAVDLWPYSGRQNGAVTDAEHQLLWLGQADGILPGEPAAALQVGFSGGQWSCQPGRVLICGHVLDVDSVQSGPLPGGAAATRRCVVAAYINRSSSPWTYGIELVAGTPGAGRPTLSASLTGKYQAPLRAVDIASNGGATALLDERPRLLRTGTLPATVEASDGTNETTSSANWTPGTSICEVAFTAPRSGRILVHLYARAHGALVAPPASVVLAFSIRRSTPGGPMVYAPNTDDGPVVRSDLEIGAGTTRLITGLTAGEQYYARVAHRTGTSGRVVAVSHRRITVQPLEN